jgi:hypothetical protein
MIFFRAKARPPRRAYSGRDQHYAFMIVMGRGAPVRTTELFIVGTAPASRAKMKTAMPSLKCELYGNRHFRRPGLAGCVQQAPDQRQLFAVSGSMICGTSVMLDTGIPLSSACLWIVASSLAR